MPFFDKIWSKIILEPWFYDLPPWLQNKTNALLALLGLFLLGLLALYFLFFRGFLRERRNTAHRRAANGEPLSSGKDLAALKKAGKFLELGRRYEDLGQQKKALGAFRKGGHHSEAAELLVRMGKLAEARREAKDGQVWALYASLSNDAEDLAEAAPAFERAQKPLEAAQAWEKLGEIARAARCYIAAAMPYDAVRILDNSLQKQQQEGHKIEPQELEELETALRAGLNEARGTAMSPESAAALRRAAQWWLALQEPDRGYELAIDAEQWAVAVPIARDYLAPNPAAAEICLRAGDRLAAAEIYRKLGESRKEALCRAEHLQSSDPEKAAQWYEKAEAWAQAADLWAARGQKRRAAELFERAEEFDAAEQLYLEIGDQEKAQSLSDRRSSQNPQNAFDQADAQLRQTSQDPMVETASASAINDAPTVRSESGFSSGDSSSEVSSHDVTAFDRPGFSSDAAKERYRILDEVGRGAMGVVYRAWDAVLDRHVAYKALPRDKNQGGSELLNEARVAARLSHPNIVQIYDAGMTSEGYFLVMEFIDGPTFQALLKEKRLSVSGALVVGRQILAALDHAHTRKLVHRDVKPSNLMWTGDQVKLADFGLARVLEATQGNVQTHAAGTPYYMAPEQIRGLPVSPQTDLYSFGCVLYEMICRRPPFRGDGSAIYHHINTAPEDPRVTREDLPENVALLILQCLEKEPADRPASAKIIAEALSKTS